LPTPVSPKSNTFISVGGKRNGSWVSDFVGNSITSGCGRSRRFDGVGGEVLCGRFTDENGEGLCDRLGRVDGGEGDDVLSDLIDDSSGVVKGPFDCLGCRNQVFDTCFVDDEAGFAGGG
jgi:hypothetical protein